MLIIGGAIALVVGIVLAIIGNNKNGDMVAVAKDLLEGGNGKPGNTLLYIGIALAVIGAAVAIYAFLKKKKAQ